MARNNTQPVRKEPATLWVFQSFEDYAACRCALLHGLYSGFVLAQQAVEKLLKAYLHLAYPELNSFVGRGGLTDKVLPVVAGHDLVAHGPQPQRSPRKRAFLPPECHTAATAFNKKVI